MRRKPRYVIGPFGKTRNQTALFWPPCLCSWARPSFHIDDAQGKGAGEVRCIIRLLDASPPKPGA